MSTSIINKIPLTPEQQKFVDSWAWGPYLSVKYFLAMGLPDQAIHQLVLTFWGANWPWTRMKHGRRIAWEQRDWTSFEEFRQAQTVWDIKGRRIAIMTAVGGVICLAVLVVAVIYTLRQAKQ